MISFGTRHQVSNSNSAQLVLALLISAFCSYARADNRACERLREELEAGHNVSSSLKQLETEISHGSPCAKNTLGVLYAKGSIFSRDTDRAYAIFYDLSQSNYPPAQLNLALILVERRAPFDVALPSYLLGLFAKYFGDHSWGHVGAAARDLGREYLDEGVRANPDIAADIAQYRAHYESAVKSVIFQTAAAVLQREKAVRDRNDAIAGLLTLGVALAQLPSLGLFRTDADVPKPLSVGELYSLGILH
jgi:hypothetical protein